MQKQIQLGLIALTVASLTACSSGGNLKELVPDRRPDYRSSRMENALEVPPDLTAASIDSQYAIPDFNPTAMATYSAYAEDRVQRNQRGYIEVLPPLPGVNIVEAPGQLPYIVVDAAPEITWRAVKRYWNQNGIRLAVEDPAIGLMETDWLINKADLPSTGISSILDGILSFATDTGERDRYRIRFSRDGADRTTVTLIYSQSVEEPEYERSGSKQPIGFSWSLSDTQNPELQLEMTRRVALYVANELRRQGKVSSAAQGAQAAGKRFTELAQATDGTNVLVFNGSYDQAWRALGIGLDNASYAIEQADYNTGTYRVQYQPQSEAKSESSWWDRLWGNTNNTPQTYDQPIYLVRLADQGKYSVAVVQNTNGSPTTAAQASQVLEAIYATL